MINSNDFQIFTFNIVWYRYFFMPPSFEDWKGHIVLPLSASEMA